MNRLAIWTAVALFLAGCAGFQTAAQPDPAVSVSAQRDGLYDNNTFLVNPQAMSLSRIMESLYSVRTEVQFRSDEDGRVFKKSLNGTGVVVFDKYLLTVEHVVSLDRVVVDTPFGEVPILASKVAEETYLEYRGKSYRLERLVTDRDVDVALFRLPQHLGLRSFPYRIGNSDDLEVGNFVYLIGNPMNYGINVREGIVSSLKAPKVINRVNSIADNAFMVSNGLNPGDSGTPVIAIRDGKYELVGLSQGSFTRSQRLGWVIRLKTLLRRIQVSFGNQLAALDYPGTGSPSAPLSSPIPR
ncbi:MAG: trypsin-like peptidase domain-containing protein [Nitrospinota bacterium]